LPRLRTNIWHVLKTSQLQLGKTARFLCRAVFLLPSEGIFSANAVFESFARTAQPSWQDHTTRSHSIVLQANTATDESVPASLRKAKEEFSPSTLLLMP